MTQDDVKTYVRDNAPRISKALCTRGFTPKVADVIALDATLSYGTLRFDGEDGTTPHFFGFDLRLAADSVTEGCVPRVAFLAFTDATVVVL